ncbi:hypothetical protein C8R47DRAFT_1104380 [Mycena vitilis]|nr:hypothetical protein C8R47DRAFT_1104380 [Mycena vitilis]
MPPPPQFGIRHPLHPDQIQKLPLTFKVLANRAMKHSVHDWIALADSIREIQTNFPPSIAICILPVIYANLDPASIPSIDTIENMIEERLIPDAMECALSATQALYLLQNPDPCIPVAAMVDIWPRYWPWIEFLQIFARLTTPRQRRLMGHIAGLGEFEVGSNVVTFMANFEDERVCKVFGATPGVRILLARNWFLLINPERGSRDVDVPLESVYRGIDQVFSCISAPFPIDASHPAGLDEFAEGAGGTIDDLASLIIQSINFLVPGREPSVPRLSLKFVWTILTFVSITDGFGTDHATVTLWSHLPADFVPVLTRVVHNVAESTLSFAKETLEMSCFLLELTFADPQSVEEALKADLLQALRRCVSPSKVIMEQLVYSISAYLLDLGIVRSIEGALPGAEDVVGSPLATSQIWAGFIDSARSRINVRRALSNCIACDNMTCAVTSSDKTVFKRCICNNRYCSKGCQIADWRAGHRSVCRALIAGNDRKQSKFVRTVVHQDYELLKADTIYPEQVRFMAKFPAESFFTLFDYTETDRPRIEVDSVEKLESETREAWADIVSRARDGEAPMELHVVRDIVETVILPLRTNSWAVRDGMRDIATSLPAAVAAEVSSPALVASVQAVLDREKDNVVLSHLPPSPLSLGSLVVLESNGVS